MLKLYPAKLTKSQFESGAESICNLEFAVKPRVIKNINGDWSLSFVYPAGRIEAGLIETDMLVLADGQLYRIESAIKSDSGGNETISVRAVHLFYDLRDRSIENIETSETTPGGINQSTALQQVLHQSAFVPGPTDPDIPVVLDYLDILQKDVVWAIKEQILAFWGGELYPDNWTINIKHRIGADRGVQMRYGKNIKGVRMEENLNGTITRLHIIGYNGANIESINSGRDYIDSPNINKYANIKEGYVTFPDDDLPEDLLSKGQEYLSTVDIPRINVSVDLPEIKGSLQYRFYRDLERVELGDTITVYHKGLKINIKARVQRREYNPVTGENYRVDIGNDTNDLYSRIASIQQATEIIKMIADRKGHIRGERLRGVVDLLTTRLYASGSFTQAVVNDKTGLLFENVNSESVDYGAMYIGPGIFAISDEQDQNGTWIWRTFGTGQGFVGNELIAHSITANKLASDVGQSLDLSSNESISSLVESIGTLEDSINDPQTGLTALGSNLSNVKNQLDGKIETFNQTNDPAAAWNTPELKASHIGDLWYHPTTNESKRWDGTSWKLLQDKEALAAKALATVKRRVFITQPTPPYDEADLWLTSTQANKADMMTCVMARASGNYTASDWMKLVKYTDDSYASTKYEQTNNAFRWLLGYGPAAGLDINNAQTYLGLDANGLKFVGNNVDISANETITLHADRINQKASQTEVNTLTGRVEAAESEIEQTPEMISTAVRGIQVGGTNLLRNSSNFKDTSFWNIYTANGGVSPIISPDDNEWGEKPLTVANVDSQTVLLRNRGTENHPFAVGEEYTVSFWAYYDDTYGVSVRHPGGTDLVMDFGYVSPKPGVPAVGAYRYYEKTAKVTGSPNQPWLNFVFSTRYRRFTKFKLERGNKATPWSPSPLDIDYSFSTHWTQIQQNKSDITTKANAATVIGMETRLQTAEQKIEPTAITQTVKSGMGLTKSGTLDSLLDAKVNSSFLTENYSTRTQTDNKIKDEVVALEVGGVNILQNSSNFINLQYWNSWSSSGGQSMMVYDTDPWGEPCLYLAGVTSTTVLMNNSLTGYKFRVGDTYTLSFWALYSDSYSVWIRNPSGTNTVADFGNIAQKKALGSWSYYEATAKVTEAHEGPMALYLATNGNYRRFSRFKLERGSKATDWSPAPKDPASSVKTSKVEIGPDFIDMSTGGSMSISAGSDFNVRAGKQNKSLGISNNEANGYMLWAGASTPAQAPFSVTMDGSLKAINLDGAFVLGVENGGTGETVNRTHRGSTVPSNSLGRDGDLYVLFNGAVGTTWNDTNLTFGSNTQSTYFGVNRNWNYQQATNYRRIGNGTGSASFDFGTYGSFVCPAATKTLNFKFTTTKYVGGQSLSSGVTSYRVALVSSLTGTILATTTVDASTSAIEREVTLTTASNLTQGATYYLGIYYPDTTELNGAAVYGNIVLKGSTSSTVGSALYVKTNGAWVRLAFA